MSCGGYLWKIPFSLNYVQMTDNSISLAPDAHKLISTSYLHLLQNRTLADLTKSSIKHLQRILNAAATMLPHTRLRKHITSLKLPHTLLVSYRTDLKILILIFKCLHGTASAYLGNMITNPARSLGSSNGNLLVPKAWLKSGNSGILAK